MPMLPDTFTNNAVSSIAGGASGAGTTLLAADTSLLLPTGGGAKYPTAGNFSLLLGTLTGAYELVQCTGRSTDTLTIVRAQEGTTALAWAVGTPVEQIVSAGNLANLWKGSTQVFNVMAYGATGNGSTDDTTAIQAAITAAGNNGGGVVFFPTGNYLISASLTIAAENIHLVGGGRSSQLTAAGSFSAVPMIWYQAPVSGFRHGCVIQDILLVNTAGSTSAIGIQLDGTYYATINRVDVEGVYATNIYLNGGNGGAFGAYTHIRDCHIGATVGGAGSAGIGVLTNSHEWDIIEGCVFAWFDQAGGTGIKVQNDSVSITDCTFDVCDTSIFAFFCNYITVHGCHFDRGLTRFIYNNGAKYSRYALNDFQTRDGSGTGTSAVVIDNTSGDCLLSGNIWKAGTAWTNAVQESGTSFTKVQRYIGNDFGSFAIVRASTNGGIFTANTTYNPVGQVTAPSFPATTVAATNTTGVDVTAYIANGAAAITVVQVAGIGGSYVTTGYQIAASGWGQVRIPAGGSVKLTYASGSPSWTWFGD